MRVETYRITQLMKHRLGGTNDIGLAGQTTTSDVVEHVVLFAVLHDHEPPVALRSLDHLFQSDDVGVCRALEVQAGFLALQSALGRGQVTVLEVLDGVLGLVSAVDAEVHGTVGTLAQYGHEAETAA